MGFKKLSNEQELILVEEYRSGASVKSLMEKYGYSTKKSITDKVKKHYPDSYQQIIKEAKSSRKDYNYKLEEIKSEFDAYFIGLLATDGYVIPNKGVGIDLTDEDCIKFLSETIGHNYKKYESLAENSGFNSVLPRYRLILSDIDLIKNLERFSIIPNKSYTIHSMNLLNSEEKYIPYIIRGIIDGDGCVFSTSYGAPAFYIVSMSESFIDWIIYILENKMYMKDIKKRVSENGLWRIETALQENIEKLLALSYNKPFGMSRKYKKLTKTFRDYNSTSLSSKDEGIVQTTTEIGLRN